MLDLCKIPDAFNQTELVSSYMLIECIRNWHKLINIVLKLVYSSCARKLINFVLAKATAMRHFLEEVNLIDTH